MDCRELKLECADDRDGKWYVYDQRSGMKLSDDCRDSEEAWMKAADRLAAILSDIRRSATNLAE